MLPDTPPASMRALEVGHPRIPTLVEIPMTGCDSSLIALCGIPLSLLSQAPTVSTASVTPCTSFATMFRTRINQHLAFLLHRNDSITTPSFPIATSTIFHAFHTNLLQTLLPQQSIPVLFPTWRLRPSTISPVYHLQQTLRIGQRLTFLPHLDLSTFYLGICQRCLPLPTGINAKFQLP